MGFLDVRRIAAVDMYGSVGSVRRRRVIRWEFNVGAVLCLLLGMLSIALATGSGKVFGVGHANRMHATGQAPYLALQGLAGSDHLAEETLEIR